MVIGELSATSVASWMAQARIRPPSVIARKPRLPLVSAAPEPPNPKQAETRYQPLELGTQPLSGPVGLL
jgi:hypothetical protein